LQIETGVATDWALAAPGFFLLRDPETGRYLVTRAGLFVANSEGRLVSYEGFCVQGWPIDGSEPNDIHVPSALARLEHSEPKTSFSVSLDGTLFSHDSYGDRHLEGRLAVVALPAATPLRQATSSCYYYPEQLGLKKSDRAVASPRVRVGWLEASAITPELAAKRRELKFIQQGALMPTGFETDLAIDGSGFFLLRDPVADRLYAIRAGAFEWDDEGYLVTSKVRFYPSQSITGWTDEAASLVMSTLPGLRLQGYRDPGSLVVGDLRVEPGWIGPGRVFSIRRDGEMRRRSPEDEEVVCGQILLQLFASPERLQRAVLASGEISRIVYTDLEGAIPASSLVAPGSNGAGSILGGALEVIAPDDRPVQPVDLREPAFAIRGQPQSRYTIESSIDLRSWVAVAECETDFYGQALVLVCSIANPWHQTGAFASWYHTLAGPSLPWLPMPGFDSGHCYSPNARPASFGMVYSGQPSAIYRLRLTQ